MATQPINFLEKNVEHLDDATVVIVSTQWNKEINTALIEGALEILKAYEQIKIEFIEVPGCVELGYAIKQFSSSHNSVDAFIAFGCVIRGGTPHFDYVCRSVTDSVTQLNLELESPVIFGVLTLESEQQAWERLGGVHGHKGKEAAETALAMIDFKQNL